MRKIYLVVGIVLALFVAAIAAYYLGFSPKRTSLPFKKANAIYYWKTWFEVGDEEIEFLKKNEIKRMYVRFFDVAINKNSKFRDKCAPVATISFDERPLQLVAAENIEIIPVVFITQEAIREYSSFTDDLAHRLYEMCSKNKIDINEVQLDCDWTKTTHDAYFQFVKDVRQTLNSYFKKEVILSSTIRLHQLAQTPPEVDYGMLMCYNTGNFRDYKTQNSILDVKDVKPYMKYLKSYNLPLVLGLPVYSWVVEFDEDKQFVRLRNPYDAHGWGKVWEEDCETGNGEEEYFEREESHKAKKMSRYEVVSDETILEAKRLVRSEYGNIPVALYHLDLQQLSKYSENEIKDFYNK